MKVRTRKLAVFVTCLGLAAAFPGAELRRQGRRSAQQQAVSGQEGEASPKKPKPNNKGKKCGFEREHDYNDPVDDQHQYGADHHLLSRAIRAGGLAATDAA